MNDFNYETDDPFTERPAPKKRQRPRPKRCVTCRVNVEDDGYGDWVHSGSEDYPACPYGCQYYDDVGQLIHLRVDDPRFSNVATV
jgi:hypothetical protein